MPMSSIRLNNDVTDTSVWRLITWSELYDDSPEQVYERFVRYNVIALGWSFVGDLRVWLPSSPAQIEDRIRRNSALRNASAGGRSLYSFYRVMKEGDLVILVAKGRRKKVIEVTGSYDYVIDNNLTKEDLYHRRDTKTRNENGRNS